MINLLTDDLMNCHLIFAKMEYSQMIQMFQKFFGGCNFPQIYLDYYLLN